MIYAFMALIYFIDVWELDRKVLYFILFFFTIFFQ